MGYKGTVLLFGENGSFKSQLKVTEVTSGNALSGYFYSVRGF
ncbi:MAG: hypothetical protein R6U03_14415 [Gillisia sp.]